MNRVLCSTGAVVGRANGGDFRMPARVNDLLPCDGWEFLMTTAFYGREEEILRAFEGLNIPVFHTDKRIGESVSAGDMTTVFPRFEQNCRLAKALGAKLLVHHLWGGLASDQQIERNIASYTPLREIAERHGLLLTVENVVCNQRDPMTHLRALAEEYPDIAFTFDTKMAAFHSQLEDAYAPENAWLWARIAHMHINDYAGGRMDWGCMGAKLLGEGNIDIGRFFAFAEKMGYAGDFTLEAAALTAAGEVRAEELSASLERIRRRE